LIELHRGGGFCCCAGVVIRTKVEVFLVSQPVETQAERRFAAGVYKENTSCSSFKMKIIV
jgi:hypothetical protein